jgi:protein involved in polysaccharide export with SLBB domain
MRTSKYATDSDACVHSPVKLSNLSPSSIARNLALCLFAGSLALSAFAQQQMPSGYNDSSQSTSGSDCTDPAMANSSQCAAQGSQDSNSLINPQSPQAYPNAYGSSSQIPSAASNYSDVERLNRQSYGRNPFQPNLLPPEPLTEFQKFVASTTNQVLPIYGASLFMNVPSTFSPLDLSPVPADFVIGPGDELRIRVWGQVNFQANLRVDRSGEVYLPQVGPVHVAGVPFADLDAHLRAAIGRVYRNFDLTADMGQTRSIQVYLSGQARRPGVYTVSGLSTLVDALFASGGPSLNGSLRHIELRRNGTVVTDFDLYDLLVHGDKSKDVPLQSGDVIYIPAVGPEVAVTGSVRDPAIYELRANETVKDLIADAGGASTVAAESRISIERIDDHQSRFAMEVAYDPSGLATPLNGGDLVRVFSLVPLYKKTVILRGNIANPGRFAWHAGMHVSDLIPDKDSLITRNYWWKRAQLGLPSPEFIPSQNLSRMHQPLDNHAVTLKSPSANEMNGNGPPPYGRQQGAYSNGNSYNPNGQQIYNSNEQGQYGSDYGSQPSDAAALALPDTTQVPGQPSQPEVQNGQYGQQQNGTPYYRNQYEEQHIGRSSLAAQQSQLANRYGLGTPKTEVKQLAPELDWNYAVIERMDPTTLKTKLIPFDLGKLVMQHDASQNMELEAGDVVSIFSDADIHVPVAQQTKLVTLGGEFVHSGVYSVLPGETLRQLVERAGGLSPDAYLYGSEYTRESTRISQQARIDEYVNSLGLEIQRNTLALASSGISAQDVASGTATQSGAQELISNLHKIRATGRIVLKFTPDSKSLSSLPDITMDDGDQFFVPAVPATVNVVGSVYNQNSFLYETQQRAGAYIAMAGGPTRDADWKHEFIIRADGEVVSHDLGGGVWSNKFNNVHMFAGDTIVVPEKGFKPSNLRALIAWSSLVSNFALGAAALTVIQ